jgi:hypothetical protein
MINAQLLSGMRRFWAGVLVSVALAGALIGSFAGIASAAPAASAASLTAASGSPQACAADAYAAITQHKVITATPAGCEGLSPSEVNQAAADAIRMAETGGTKSAVRSQAVAESMWVRALITDSEPAPGSSPAAVASGHAPAADPGGTSSALGLGGVSELGAKVGALLAWLATVASGGWVLARWLLAGGRLRRGTATATPPSVILAHVGGGAAGLLLWAVFMLTGWVPLAWIALGMLAPVAGLGMGVLLIGLPRPVARRIGRQARMPVVAIAMHGLFVVIVLLLVLMATIGAG